MAAAVTVDQIASAPNLRAVLDAYAAESAITGMPAYAEQIDAYKAMEAGGLLRAFASFDGDQLIGFVFLMICYLPHYGAKVATTESFFVMPEHRKDGHGDALRRAAETTAATLGAVGILISAPFGGKLAHVLERAPGYRETNRVFFKALP